MREVQTQTPPKQETQTGVTTPRTEPFWQPFAALRGEMDRLFDSFWRGFGAPMAPRPQGEAAPFSWNFERPFGLSMPVTDLVESDGEYRITAELPGMDAKDIELTVSDGLLTIRGEKKASHEEKSGTYQVSERRYGAFERSFRLPRDADRDKLDASFEKGVLTVRLPKVAAAPAQPKKIAIKQGG